MPFTKTPEELTFEAQALIKQLGVTAPAVGRHSQFVTSWGYLEYWRTHDEHPSRPNHLAEGRPAALYFWYRQSPHPLEADRLGGKGRSRGWDAEGAEKL